MGNILTSPFASSPPSIQVQELRQKAQQCWQESRSLAQKSQQAWTNGDKALAAEFKRQRLQVEERAKEYDSKASKLAIRLNNDKRTDKHEVDLHGLYVKEAIEYVESRIRTAKQRKWTHLIVITGRGNHSENGPKLKPAVYEELSRKHDLRVFLDRPNDGCIYVEFVKDKSLVGVVWDFVRRECNVM